MRQKLMEAAAAPARALQQAQLEKRTRQLLQLQLARKPVPQYTFNVLENTVALKCDYASAEILNPTDWDTTRRHRKPYQVDVVYTQYPRDTANWITPYNRLMGERIRNLLALAPQLADSTVRWVLTPQTAPRTATEAKTAFHGFVIKYRMAYAGLPKIDPVAAQEGNLDFVKRVIGGYHFPDSVIYKAIVRHPEWQNKVVVLDWTGSMYPYGAQFVRWHRQFAQRNLVRALVLFNDGDDFVNGGIFRNKPIGQTGGIYTCDAANLEEVIATMEEAMMRGDGTEPTENNVEALLYAQKHYPGADRLIMVADNNSGMRDLELLPKLNKPVDIVLCGLSKRKPVNKQLMKIAWQTGGSLIAETDELKFSAPAQTIPPAGVAFYGRTFVLKGGKFYGK
jgi:hypothetical protein